MDFCYEQLNEIGNLLGKSFYVLDTDRFFNNYRELESSFNKIYQNTQIAYSYKTNYIPQLCQIINENGGYAEVVSDMELELAMQIGVPGEKIIFNGPYKNEEAVEKLLLSGGTINIDSIHEIKHLKTISEKHPSSILNIGIRCNFDVGDGILSRFGVDVESLDFKKILSFLKKTTNINFNGLHCHYASRDLETWKSKVFKMLETVEKLHMIPERIDLGGGIFGNMNDELKGQFNSYIPSYEEYAEIIAGGISNYFQTQKPMLIIEPGSALVGDAMYFVTVVTSIKKNQGKDFATLYGSIYNISPTLNHKNMPVQVYHKTEGDEYRDIDFCGYTCIESDYLYRNYRGRLGIGDYIVFENIGSYSVVLKPPFILPNFAIVIIKSDNSIEIIKEKESFYNIFQTYKFEVQNA